MPRKAPGPNNGVTEHRITLGDFERKQLVQAIDAYQRDKWLENVPYMIISAGAIGVAGAAGVAAYALYRFVGLEGEIAQMVKNTTLDLVTTVTGDSTLQDAANLKEADSVEQCNILYNSKIDDLEEGLRKLKTMPFPINSSVARQRMEKEIFKYKELRRLCYLNVRYKENTGTSVI